MLGIAPQLFCSHSGLFQGIVCGPRALSRKLWFCSSWVSNSGVEFRRLLCYCKTSFDVFVHLVWWDSIPKAPGIWLVSFSHSLVHCPCPKANTRWERRIFPFLKDGLLHILLWFLMQQNCQLPVYWGWRIKRIDCCLGAKGEKTTSLGC